MRQKGRVMHEGDREACRRSRARLEVRRQVDLLAWTGCTMVSGRRLEVGHLLLLFTLVPTTRRRAPAGVLPYRSQIAHGFPCSSPGAPVLVYIIVRVKFAQDLVLSSFIVLSSRFGLSSLQHIALRRGFNTLQLLS